jgi:hypothetical protein
MRPASSPAEPAAPGAGEAEGCVAPPTATGVAGGVLPGLALADAEALTDRLGLGVALTVGLGVAGRAVAATGVGLGVGRGVAGTVTVIWPAGRSAALPWAVAEKATVRVPAENRLDPRQLPFEVVPLTRLSGTVTVPTCATTLVAGLPE